jgi:hypothetical protein
VTVAVETAMTMEMETEGTTIMMDRAGRAEKITKEHYFNP